MTSVLHGIASMEATAHSNVRAHSISSIWIQFERRVANAKLHLILNRLGPDAYPPHGGGGPVRGCAAIAGRLLGHQASESFLQAMAGREAVAQALRLLVEELLVQQGLGGIALQA